jgi:transposase
MSTSLLYHGFGLTTQEYLKTEYSEGNVTFYTQTKSSKLRCSQCGSKQVVKRGSKIRDFRGIPIGLKPVIIKAKIQRLACSECGAVRQEKIMFADEKKVTPIASVDM